MRIVWCSPIIALAVAVAAILANAMPILAPSMAVASLGTPSTRQVEISPALLPTRPDATDDPARQPEYRLALLSSWMEAQGSYTTFQGLVENLTDRPVDGVLAVVVLYDGSRVARLSANALIEASPLMPGQVSPWRVTMRNHPEYPLFGVEFRQWHVGTLSTRDDRPR